MSSKYLTLRQSLQETGAGEMQCFGNSMLPILSNPSLCTYRAQATYAVGDIVFCKVNGRFIDAHKITKIGADGRFMIANNRGHENGWTKQVYGRVVAAKDKSGHQTDF